MISLSKTEIDNSEISAVEKVLRSGWLVQGNNVKAFEQKISEFLGVKYAVAVSSGTAALHLALLSIGITEGDEVIIPDFTFPATANAVILCGAKPVFVDINIDTYNIDISKIEDKITSKTKAIIPVHQFGMAADMVEIKKIAGKYSVIVVEDAACALGAKTEEGYCGTLGEIGCFSFHPRKIITTGEGGIVVTNNQELAEKIKILRNHGIKRDNEKTDFVYPGFNYRMTDFQAAIGINQLKKINFFINKRIENAELYFQLLAESNKLTLPLRSLDFSHIYQTFHVLLENKIDRNIVIDKMHEFGIETNYGANALSLLTVFKKYSNAENFKNSQRAFSQGLALPFYPSMRKEEIEFVSEKLLVVLSALQK